MKNSLSLLGVDSQSVVAVMNPTDHVTFYVFGLLHWRAVKDFGVWELIDTECLKHNESLGRKGRQEKCRQQNPWF